MKFNHRLCYYILDNTTEAIFGRGIEYFKSGRVNSLTETDKGLNAVIEGSRVYSVEFCQGPKYIKGCCNCPYFQSNSDYCKHIVAVAVARDTDLGFSLLKGLVALAGFLALFVGLFLAFPINTIAQAKIYRDLQGLVKAE